MRWTRTCVLLTVLLPVARGARAQAPPIRVATSDWILERWSTDQGLPQATVSDIAQTPDGYIWLATNGGLVRFDGVRFTPFTSNDFPALGSDRVSALRTAPDGSLWIGTDRGLVHFSGGAFREWTEVNGRPPGYTTGLFVDTSGVWTSTSVGGVGHLVGGTFERFSARELGGGFTSRVVRDRDGRVWVHSADFHEFVLEKGARHFVERPLHTGDITARVLAPQLSADSMPMFETSRGAAAWNGHALVPLGLGDGLIVSDGGGGGYWASTSSGVAHVDAHGARTLVAGKELLPAKLKSDINSIRSVFVDRDGTLWLGTNTSGLIRLRRRVVHMYLHEDGLAGEQVTAIMRDDRGRLIVGSSCGATSTMRAATLSPSTLPGCAFSLAQGADGTLWVAPIGSLRAVNRAGLESVPSFASRLPNKNILAMYADRDSSLWIGTENGLVHEMRGQLRQYGRADGLPSTEIHYITRDRHGALWVGSVGGLARLDGDRFTAWTKSSGLTHNYVRAIHQDADGVYWIGTYGGGLSRFDGTHFRTISTDDGLYDNIVSAILEDSAGNLWMSGNRGIYRASLRSLNAFASGAATKVASVGYGPSDGLMTAETNGGFEPSAWQDPDGRLWFATVRGLASIDPAAESRGTTAPPRLAIESFRVDGHAMAPEGRVVVPVGSRYLEIVYTGLTSIAPEQLSFRYRLDGFDHDWAYVNTRRTAYYSQLAPGTYTFTVSAANRDGMWNPEGRHFSFTVPAPWYATLWFRALVVIALVGGSFAVMQRRIEAGRARERVQREFARHLLLGQEIERGRIAGELHDSLGQDLLVMKNRAALALATNEVTAAVRPHVEEIANVATLAVQHAREMSHGLRPYQLKHLGLAASLAQLGEAAASASGAMVSVSAEGVDERFNDDASIQIYRIVQEALNNILKHAAARNVTISITPDGADVALRVADDGRGMNPGQAVGFGLNGIQQRIQLLGGTMTLRSAPGEGTAIAARIPASAR